MFCSSQLLPWHSTNGTDQGMQQCPTACRANCSHLKPAGKHLQMPRQNHTPAPLCHHSRALAVAASHKFPRAIQRQDSRNVTSTVGMASAQAAHTKAHVLLSWGTPVLTPVKGHGHPLPPGQLPALVGCTQGSSGVMTHGCPPSLPRATSQGQDLSPP